LATRPNTLKFAPLFAMALPFFNKRNKDNQEMSFVDHLEELRGHITRSILVILVFAITIFIYIDEIFDYVIMGPMRPNFITYTGLCNFSHWAKLGDALCMPAPNVKLQAMNFSTQFMSSITIAFVGGFIVAFPYVFWEFWKFIRPALNQKELKAARGGIFWVSFFFFTGAAFGYFLLAPFTFSFLANYTMGKTGFVTTIPTLDDYTENMVDIILGAGIAFQLPIISYVLTKIGLITPNFLRTYRKYALVAILVIAAVITPSPDWTSQMLVFVPLALLFEIGVIISARVYKAEQKKMNEW